MYACTWDMDACMIYISGYGQVWYGTWFGTKEPGVQIPLLGPIVCRKQIHSAHRNKFEECVVSLFILKIVFINLIKKLINIDIVFIIIMGTLNIVTGTFPYCHPLFYYIVSFYDTLFFIKRKMCYVR